MCIQQWCMPNFYSLINARFNERLTDANLHPFVTITGDILSSQKSNTSTQPLTRAHWLWTCLWWLSLFVIFSQQECKHVKAAYSVTMNIFRKFSFLFKSFVKVELGYVFTIKMFSTAENCMEKWIILSNRCIFLLLVIICVPPIIIDR